VDSLDAKGKQVLEELAGGATTTSDSELPNTSPTIAS
jgi:hypothetical protein